MKKRIWSMGIALGTAVSMMAGGAVQAADTWTVTCPWAPSGVAAMVSQQVAAKSAEYSDDLILVAEAVKGDAATVNTWVASNGAGDPSLVFAGEGLFSITSILDPAKLQFDYENFAYVENLYSSVFVLSAEASLELESVEALKTFVESGEPISVAVNGAAGSEAFLAASLFGAMGGSDQLKLVPYESAAEAAQAVSKGETKFAVSHQSQILETQQQGDVTIVCAFDEKTLENGPFAGVEGVGEYGYPYFRNRCFVLAPAGTDEETVAALKTLYDDILSDEEVAAWLQDTMLLEVDTMEEADVEAHIENVKSIVEEYKDIVAG